MEGVFAMIFGGSTAKLLDQSVIVGNMEQTIPMLAESTNLSYKTVKTALNKLIALGFVTKRRKIGNAQTFRFEVEGNLSVLIDCYTRLARLKILERYGNR